jgi:hypothetical protein
MTDVARVVVELGGWFGAPGANVWHFCAMGHGTISDENVNGFLEDLKGAYANTSDQYAPGVTFTFPAIVPVFTAETGTLVYFAGSDEPQASVTGSGNGTESRATQALLQLGTSDIRNNRLVQGRSFLGPLGSAQIGADGLVTSTCRTLFAAQFGPLASAIGPRLAVWSRPNGTLAGQVSDVQSVVVRQRPGTLRGRNK